MEILDCQTCDRPKDHCASCPIQYQPVVTERIKELWKLWCRMKEYSVMPHGAGILHEPNDLMRLMDVITNTHNEWQKKNKKKGRAGNARH